MRNEYIDAYLLRNQNISAPIAQKISITHETPRPVTRALEDLSLFSLSLLACILVVPLEGEVVVGTSTRRGKYSYHLKEI